MLCFIKDLIFDAERKPFAPAKGPAKRECGMHGQPCSAIAIVASVKKKQHAMHGIPEESSSMLLGKVYVNDFLVNEEDENSLAKYNEHKVYVAGAYNQMPPWDIGASEHS